MLNFFKKYKLQISIFLIWLFGFFLRIYRQDQLLGFYYDQGRDALMAKDIITFTNFPAIGPTTGINGLFLGPFWYYLITPGYLLSAGNPAIASWFISFLESLTIPLIFILLSKYSNKKSATLASIFWALSYYLIRSSRWFSNPSPLPFFVLLHLFLLSKIFIDKKYKFWIPLAFVFGLSLQLEAASAIFFAPVILFLLIKNKEVLPSTGLKNIFLSILSFFLTLLPQLAFEIKNNFLVTKTFFGFLTGKVNSDTGKSWGFSWLSFIFNRLHSYYEIFFSKLDTNTTWVSLFFFAILIIGLIYIIYRKQLTPFTQIIISWLFIPLFILLFFVGNYGTLYDYYLTGFFPAFIILFSICLVSISSIPLLRFLPFIVLILFFYTNLPFIKNYITAGTDGPTHISLGNQMQSIKAVCQQDQPYNLSVYVPPIKTYTYDYLLSWYASSNPCYLPDKNNDQKILYTLYEVDLQNPSLLVDWIVDKDKFSSLDSEQIFGGIHLQKRIRQNF